MFTPDNRPELGHFYFPDVRQMAEFSGSDPVWIEETMGMSFQSNIRTSVYGETEQDLLKAYDREPSGIPIGRPAEVNLRNNHTQYIFTW